MCMESPSYLSFWIFKSLLNLLGFVLIGDNPPFELHCIMIHLESILPDVPYDTGLGVHMLALMRH